MSQTHTHTHKHTARRPIDSGVICFGDDLGHIVVAHALFRQYCTLRCRRMPLNALLSSVILGKLKDGNAPAERQPIG